MAMAVTAATMAAKPPVQSRSPHTTSEPMLAPFLIDEPFDPASYLNSTLPTLSLSTRVTAANYLPLPELLSQTQTLLSQLNAHATRLSAVLTQLTDEIVRSGGRLAYEVEVLKGEAVGLGELLEGDLKKDMDLFLPSSPTAAAATNETQVEGVPKSQAQLEPPELQRLRALTQIRSRLTTVAQTFDAAMSWPLPPSELQQGNSFLSISAPESSDSALREDKGKQAADKLRAEITGLIGDGRDIDGLEAAETKIKQLRELVNVWKGTMEEKARTRFVDELEKVVEEAREKQGGKKIRAGLERTGAGVGGMDYRYGGVGGVGAEMGGYGFFSNLKNLGKDVYLD